MYNYDADKRVIFTEDGQAVFLRVRDNVNELLKKAGAVRMQEAISGCRAGDSFTLLACVDRMVELEEIREITKGNVLGQHRVFVANH